MGQAGFVLLLVFFVCFFHHNLFSFSTYSSLFFYDSISEYIYVYNNICTVSTMFTDVDNTEKVSVHVIK